MRVAEGLPRTQASQGQIIFLASLAIWSGEELASPRYGTASHEPLPPDLGLYRRPAPEPLPVLLAVQVDTV